MYIVRRDSAVLRSKEVQAMENQYKEKFGEWFIGFNYVDFPSTDEKCAAQGYKETLEKALEGEKPYHIVSHRFDVIDH